MKVRCVEAELVPGEPCLVFLHEGLGSLAQWRDFPAQLCARTGCGRLVYSRRGYGKSDPVPLPRPLTYMHEEGERELPALLMELGIENPILFGHSDGASIALVAAGSGLAVRGLILEAPHVICEEISVRSIEASRAAYEEGPLRERLARYHDHVDVAFYGWNRAWLDPGFRSWDLRSYLPKVTAPLLLLQGRGDPYGTELQLREIEQGGRGSVRTELLTSCGHAPHREQPERTLRFATELIQSIR